MGWNLHGTHAREGDLVQMVGLRHKSFTFLLKAGADFQSHRGVIRHDDIIGRPWGSAVSSHNGSPFFMLQPSLADLLRNIKRSTQILYPKDIGFILTSMGIGPGQIVVEAGTGSGALTTALAYAVGSEGRVITYDTREPFQQLARENLEKMGLAERVTFRIGDVFDGFAESGVDALFLDLPNPYDYGRQVRAALKPGGFFGSILPTTNQVTLLLKALRVEGFAFLDVCEVFLRYYRADPERFRPTDRMVAHTGFLIFARPVIQPEGKDGEALLEETAQSESVDDAEGR